MSEWSCETNHRKLLLIWCQRYIFCVCKGLWMANTTQWSVVSLFECPVATSVPQSLLCPCWTEPGTGEPLRYVVQSRFWWAFLHPSCAEEQPREDAQQTLGSFQTRSGLWPRRASIACLFPQSLPPCRSHRCCWPSLQQPPHVDPSPGLRESQNPNTEAKTKRENQVRGRD